MAEIELSDGSVLWYQKSGSGAPMLQIHGTAFGHRNFERLTPFVARSFEVIDFDLPGYGSSRGNEPKDMGQLAETVARLINALGYERLHVHGTSFGAMIALTLAASHPELIDQLILSCFLARYDNAARMMRATWKRAARDSGMDAVADLTSVAGFFRGFYDRPDAQDQLQAMRDAFSKTTPEAFIGGTETIERTDLTPLLAQIECRVLLLAGREDNMTPFSPAVSGIGFEQIQGQLPDCQTITLNDCGHYLVIEQPEKAAEAIVGFIEN